MFGDKKKKKKPHKGKGCVVNPGLQGSKGPGTEGPGTKEPRGGAWGASPPGSVLSVLNQMRKARLD